MESTQVNGNTVTVFNSALQTNCKYKMCQVPANITDARDQWNTASPLLHIDWRFILTNYIIILSLLQGLLLDCNQMCADYLFQQDKHYDVSFDTGDKVIQCGRHNDIFKCWLLWRSKVKLIREWRSSPTLLPLRHILQQATAVNFVLFVKRS